MLDELHVMQSSLMHPYYWLPSGVSWQDFESKPNLTMPDPNLMYENIGYGLFTLIIRQLFHALLGLPLANLAGVNKSSNGYFSDLFRILCFVQSNRTTAHKFIDCFWRFTFYVCSFSFGLYYVRDTSWYSDYIYCWYQYPLHPVHPMVRVHYILEASFYWSALWITIASPAKKDFSMNMAHHLVTLGLMWLSWSLNFTRVGSLVLIIHDAADIFIECGKMSRYIPGWDAVTNVMFALFILVWIPTRLMAYPALIYSALFEGPLIVPSTHYPFMIILLYCMLTLLLVLHLIWSAMIGRMVINTLKPDGKVVDERSDTEDE